MLTIIKTILALALAWLSQNTTIFYDDFTLYDSVFKKEYGTVIEQTFEGYEIDNDYYLIEFGDGNIKEIQSDDLTVGDAVTVYFLQNIPIRTVYDKR